MENFKEKLENYKNTVSNIYVLKLEIYDMVHTDKGIGSSVIMDYRTGYPRPQNVSGFDWKKYNSKIAKLEKAEKEEKEVREWIENIEDGRIRHIFKLRYINGLTWKRIAKKIGEHDESYPRKQIHDKYLKSTEKSEKSDI